MRVVAFLILAVCSTLPSYASEPTTPTDSARPSVADTKTVEFIGKKFELKFKATSQQIQIYEYFLANEAPENWLELVDFHIYPAHPGNEPMDLAKRTAESFMKKYPYMRFALYSNNNTDAVLLDYFYPDSNRKEKEKAFLEYNAFKFFRDAGSGHTMSFHYAKNIEFTNTTALDWPGLILLNRRKYR